MLKSGQKAVVNIGIQHGARVEVRLEDPKKVLPRPLDKGSAAYVKVGVRTGDGWLHGAQLRSWDDGGQEYWLVVPAKVETRVHLSGSNHEFKDDKGAAVAKNGADIAVTAEAVGGVKKLKFVVGEKGK